MILNIEPLTFSSKHKESHVDSQLNAHNGLGLVSALRICLVLLRHGLSLDRGMYTGALLLCLEKEEL